MAEKEKRVLDVLDYDEIKDVPFVQVFAEVGSGKSYFVERFIKGDPEHHIPKKKILIITSRKAKVVQTLANADLNIGDRITAAQNKSLTFCNPDDDYELYDEDIDWLKDGWGERRVFQKSTICTNAFIEKFLQWKYRPNDITTHLWNLFDIIAIDEVHSLIVDSTYQSAPFYVHSLVNETMRRQRLAEKYPDQFEAPKCKQIILMTGTPDAMDAIQAPKNSVTLDLREKCKAVQPQEVEMVSLKTAKSLIAKQLKQRKRIVYFANHTYTVQEFKDAFGIKIDDQFMGCSFSKQKKRDELKKNCKPEYDRMEQLENSMYKDSRLPPNIQLFVTTAKNKEGINIDDDNIDIIYVESHLQSDVIQMAGRVRKGIEKLCIIENPRGHEANEWQGERRISKYLIGAIPAERKEGVVYTNLNQYLRDMCKYFNIEGLCLADGNAMTTAYQHTYVGKYIDWVHEKLPYIRYNYFLNEFRYYNFRKYGVDYISQHEQEFSEILSGEKNFTDVVQKWFPAAKIMPYLPKEILAKKALEEFLKNHPNNECQKEEYDALLAQLKKILESNGQTLQPILNKISPDEKFPVRIQRKGKDPSNIEKYNTYTIER